MNRHSRMLLLVTLFVLLAAALPAFAGNDLGEGSVLATLSFDKSAVSEGIWEGLVTGDVSGALRTELTGIRTVGPLWFVEFNWIVDAGDQSFTVAATGTLNTLNGTAVMTGRVVEGEWLGATMYEQGQMIDPATGHFEGTILLIESS